MEAGQDYRHTEAWEGLCDSKELPTNNPLVSYVQTPRKNDTEQNSTTHRTSSSTINFDIYYDSCKAVKEAISKIKSELMEQRVIDCEGDQKKLFSLIHSLLGSKRNTVLPEYTSSFTLASTINMFFIDKISTIKMEFPLLEACLPMYSFVDIDIIMPACTAVFDTFHPLSCDVLSSLISKLNKTTCVVRSISD